MLPYAVSLIDQVQGWALTWLPIVLMGALVFLVWRTLKVMPRTKPQQIKPESPGSVNWHDVAGCDEAKHELREVVEFLRQPDRFHKLGATVPKGVLLHGPPGTGKTMLAKAVAGESGAHFFSQSASSFVEMFAGLQSQRVITPDEKRVIAYHEAGHALCAELLDSQEKTHRISIIPRGKALGYTLHLPQEDRYLKTREEMVDWMVVALGGRVAESIVFGAITTGAANDLEKVYSVSRTMVTDYGMGTTISSRRLPVDDYSVSEASRRIVDEEQQELTDLAFRSAQQLIAANRPLLDAFAQRLLSNEVLERSDIEEIVAAYRAGKLEVASISDGNGGDPAGAAADGSEPGAAQLAAAERLDQDAPGQP